MSVTQPGGSTRLRVLIVEDEWPAREYLVELLTASNQVEVVAAVATSDEARQVLGQGGVEVEAAFVDIHLATSGGREAGLDMVREFAGVRGAPLFVMATALRQHAAEAFDLDVVDYLLKPFSEERVRECLGRIARRRTRPPATAPARVVARSRRGLVFLPQKDAWAFEASDRMTFVHCAGGRFDIDLSLSAIETTLGGGWIRVHRNWVVNTGHVKALERDELGSVLVLGGAVGAQSGNIRVPVARDKVQGVREALLEGATGIRR
ncbi:MAG: LytTR family DNA-binding domain-containing protein [Myxococcota bacterium]|jgi:DNA-binding LytR/AlgR family response regulator